MERASGVLMPVSSLPGPYGIGGFGWNAYDFVDFLASCKQHYWQILPLTTTSYGDSPYQSFSARAGNPNFIDFAELIEAGYLEQRDIDGVYLGSDPSNVDYGAIFGGRRQILDRAAERFAADKPADFDDFIQANEDWLIPYCEFMTVKEECGLNAFWEWPAELRTRGEASAKVCADHPARMLYHQMTQYFFDRQWSRLKAYANERDILIIGDLPIYVSRDSVEMWATPELFKIDTAGNPVSVAGTPPGPVLGHRPVLGQPHLRLGRHGVRRLLLVGGPHSRRPRHVRRHPPGSLPRLRGLLGGAVLLARFVLRFVDARVPASSSSRRSRKSSARCPSSPRTWASSPPASSTCATTRASPA